MTRRKDETIPLRDPDPPRRPPRPKYSARYYEMLPTPPTLPDRAWALRYLAAIRDLMARSVWREFTRTEQSGLQRLERKWARRATGQDARWNALGTKPGRTPNAIDSTLRRPDPAWSKPT